jgi:hypothetical protein
MSNITILFALDRMEIQRASNWSWFSRAGIKSILHERGFSHDHIEL